MHCVDFDVVEEPILTRQLLYTKQDVGASKVKRAVERLRAILHPGHWPMALRCLRSSPQRSGESLPGRQQVGHARS
ncbi:ThiF family adenylyltransferase [Amycolatopsis magusensis]|uniref:ThiF family adenylyltransferase n=1 Tax=Amycolatopsis magusensis TaxID=882444 RepID=UPI003798628F